MSEIKILHEPAEGLLYKGRKGSAKVSISDGCIHGRIVGIRDLVTYESYSVSGLIKEFEKAVDDYDEIRGRIDGGKKTDEWTRFVCPALRKK